MVSTGVWYEGISKQSVERLPAPVSASASAKDSDLFDASGKRFGSSHDSSAESAAVLRELSDVVSAKLAAEKGLRIYCTLDPELQKSALQAVSRTENLEVSLLAVENESGAIRALAGVNATVIGELQKKASSAAAMAVGAAPRGPWLIARVCSATGDLLYRAESRGEGSEIAAKAIQAGEDQQMDASPVLQTLGWQLPTIGEALENRQEALITASTSSLTTCVRVGPQSRETIFAPGHLQTEAAPIWVKFMEAASPVEYPAVAFTAPTETKPEEIPMVRRAIAVVREPEVRRAIPVTPVTLAFGGTEALNPSETFRAGDSIVRRPVAINAAIAEQQARAIEPVSLDGGPVSTGNGFVVFPRSVHRVALNTRP